MVIFKIEISSNTNLDSDSNKFFLIKKKNCRRNTSPESRFRFGAGLQKDGTPSSILKYRAEVQAALVNAN